MCLVGSLKVVSGLHPQRNTGAARQIFNVSDVPSRYTDDCNVDRALRPTDATVSPTLPDAVNEGAQHALEPFQ